MVHGWEQQLVLQQHARQRRCRERRGREHHELVEAEWRLALAIGATVVTGMLGGSKRLGEEVEEVLVVVVWQCVGAKREVIFTASAIEV